MSDLQFQLLHVLSFSSSSGGGLFGRPTVLPDHGALLNCWLDLYFGFHVTAKRDK